MKKEHENLLLIAGVLFVLYLVVNNNKEGLRVNNTDGMLNDLYTGCIKDHGKKEHVKCKVLAKTITNCFNNPPIQYDGKKGAPVYSPVSGTVIRSGNEGNFGNRVRIKLADGRVIAAAHLDKTSVKSGQQIQAGQMIGTQGNTGKTLGPTGIHVDWTLYGTDGRPRTSREAA